MCNHKVSANNVLHVRLQTQLEWRVITAVIHSRNYCSNFEWRGLTHSRLNSLQDDQQEVIVLHIADEWAASYWSELQIIRNRA
jgi:hypothetical protein